MKYPPKTIGLFQAAGLTVYVSFFAIIAFSFQQWFVVHDTEPGPMLAITLFLLAFLISALICGSIVFTYPIILFLGEKKTEAVKTVFWSLGWLFIFCK